MRKEVRSIKCDLHVHTKFSEDSAEEMENYCVKAIEDKIDVICFTDHVDHNPNDSGRGYYRVTEYFEDYKKISEKYGDSLTILSGMEFDCPHMFKKEFEEYLKYPYDFVIGSVHFWYGDMFPSTMVRKNIPVEACFESYWEEILNMVAYGGFDCTGHLDFPKRYYMDSVVDTAVINEIFGMMKSRNIILEINTSSLRKGLDSPMPDLNLLDNYNDYITMGSDAHFAEDLYRDIEAVKTRAIGLNLKEAYFKSRKLIECQKDFFV